MTTDGANNSPNISEYVINNIDKAIENEWIQVYYQPIIRSITGCLCGAESLARWIDPYVGFLPPDKFIGALESSRQIHKLDCFIVDRVCRDISERLSQNLPAVPVSVNFSRLDFEYVDVLAMLEKAIDGYNIPRDYIHIEITDSMIVSDAELMTSVITNFRSAGYEVWMDDFGSGYSSLTLLKDYTFDTLKLDMNFLSNFNDKTRAIITSTVTMAKNIEIKTLAEGVETKEQVSFFKEIGCGRLQGYYYGKPMPLRDFFVHIDERDIRIEERQWRHFYEAASFHARQTDEPLEIIEDDGSNIKTLFMNSSYKRQIFDDDYSLEEIDRLIYHTASPLMKKYRQFADRLERSKNQETFYYTNNGNILSLTAKVISEHAGHYIIEGSIRNLSLDSSFNKKNALDFRLKELNHLFEVVLLLNPEANRVTPLLGKLSYIPDIDVQNTNLDERFNAFKDSSVFPMDRNRIISFIDFSTMHDRISQSPRGYIEELFRLKQENGDYEWKEIQIMPISGTREKEFLYCIKAIPLSADRYLHEKAPIDSYNSELAPGLKLEPQMWENIINNTTIKFFWKDKDRRFLGASKSFLEYFNLPSIHSILGKTDEDMSWHIDDDPFSNDELKVLNEGAIIRNVRGQCIIRGVIHNIVCNKNPMYSKGKIIGLIGYFIDIDDELSRLSIIYNQVKNDSVTGLMNAKALTDALIDYSYQYHEKQRDFGLIILRNKNHERIRSTYGSEFANRLLVLISKTILTVTGTSCAVGRTNGSTFALLTHVSDASELDFIAEKVHKEVEAINNLEGYCVTIKVAAASRMRSSQGTTDENMYSLVLEEVNRLSESPKS